MIFPIFMTAFQWQLNATIRQRLIFHTVITWRQEVETNKNSVFTCKTVFKIYRLVYYPRHRHYENLNRMKRYSENSSCIIWSIKEIFRIWSEAHYGLRNTKALHPTKNGNFLFPIWKLKKDEKKHTHSTRQYSTIENRKLFPNCSISSDTHKIDMDQREETTWPNGTSFFHSFFFLLRFLSIQNYKFL